MLLLVRCRRKQNSTGLGFKPLARLAEDKKGSQVPVHSQQTLVPKFRRRRSQQLPVGHELNQLRQKVHRYRHISQGGTLVIVKCMGGGLPNVKEKLVETV